MLGLNGGLIGKARDTTAGQSVPGVWGMTEQCLALAKGRWPGAYASYVTLLLHFDGTNGSTTITDTGFSPKSVTVAGNAQISTAQSKFGGSSLFLDGNGDYLTIPDSNDFEFGSEEFTVEFWIYLTAGTSTNRTILAKSSRDNASGEGSFAIQVSNTNRLQMLFDTGASNGPWSIDVQGSSTVSLNTWHHVAVVRLGNTFTSYLNGSSESTATNTMSLVNNAQVLTIGALGYTSNTFVNFMTGYIDEVRITKGIARYTQNFSVPTQPFPNAS